MPDFSSASDPRRYRPLQPGLTGSQAHKLKGPAMEQRLTDLHYVGIPVASALAIANHQRKRVAGWLVARAQ